MAHMVRAEALRPYMGRWVAVQRDGVLTDGESFTEIVTWLRRHNVKAEAVFMVPAEAEKLLVGDGSSAPLIGFIG